ncbi:MAG TPA: DUF5947 family protein [Verrucomicrobiae bacterium]|nr:DUF5947 family protein [Verrucomicrobiae bacterium]
MNPKLSTGQGNPFAALRRLARPRAAREHCELCNMAVGPEHRHLLERSSRKVICACDACAMRFEGVIGGRFKLIPRQPHALPDFHLADEQWESLALPINLAFFFHRTPEDKIIAYYPSPAGATESLLPLTTWEALVADNPVLHRMQPDVEALLVNRVGTARHYFLAPIDTCYELVGLIRVHWRGLSGGEEVWAEISTFFTKLAERAAPLYSHARREVIHA